MARKVWILALTEAHRAPRIDGVDLLVVTDDNTAGTEAQVLAAAALGGNASAWTATLAAEQDGAVTPAGDAIWAVGQLKSEPPGAIAT